MKRLKRILTGNLEMIIVFSISEVLGIACGIMIFVSADKHNALYYFFAIIQALAVGIIVTIVCVWILATIILVFESVMKWIFERIHKC